ncbi:MAG: sulfatase-like hydrolase/transferase [Thermoguttaceae bacterium]
MNAICLVIDRLHAGCLGAYGNTWIETPAVDLLASQSFLFDQMLIDSPDLTRLYRSYWQGCHALCPDGLELEKPLLAASLRASGVTTALVTDEPLVARHGLAGDFDEIIEIDPPWECRVASEIEQTHFARCFLRIIDWLQSAPEPFMLWCHLGGLGTIWDAPLSFRRAYCDEGDPEAPQIAETPEQILGENYDPDEVLGLMQCYAGQVSLLDSCVEAFLTFLDDLPVAKQLTLALTSSRGFPLGEHDRIGPCDEALYGELVNIPLILRFADGLGAAARSQALIEPADLWAAFSRQLQNGVESTSAPRADLISLARGDVLSLRDRLCVAGSARRRGLRTPAWYLRSADEAELYVKPDDRWEVNNVSSRCLEVVEGLLKALGEQEKFYQCGGTGELRPLDDVLIHGLG